MHSLIPRFAAKKPLMQICGWRQGTRSRPPASKVPTAPSWLANWEGPCARCSWQRSA